jgi:hypothetical protein
LGYSLHILCFSFTFELVGGNNSGFAPYSGWVPHADRNEGLAYSREVEVVE